MPISVTMPRLGESVSEGTVTRWLKQVGEHVSTNEPLLEVSTDKVDTEIPSPAAGVLVLIVVQEDETVEVGVELAVIDGDGIGGDERSSGEPAGEIAPAAGPEGEPEKAATSESPAEQEHATQTHAHRSDRARGPYVTQLVRRLATQHAIELSSLFGTGSGGRIRKQDVLDAAQRQKAGTAGRHRSDETEARNLESAYGQGRRLNQSEGPTSAPAPADANQTATARRTKHGPMRPSQPGGMLAAHATESLRGFGQLTAMVEADVTSVVRLLETDSRPGAALTILPFLALATVESLRDHPTLNAHFEPTQDPIAHHGAEHLGITIDTDRGPLVPVLYNAGDLSLAGLARKIAEMTERARSNAVTQDELGGGAFTLTDAGSRGALIEIPIVAQPQVGILGAGAVVKRATVINDPELGEVIAVRSMIYLVLGYDHRIVDGADATRFLTSVKQRLEAGDFTTNYGL